MWRLLLAFAEFSHLRNGFEPVQGFLHLLSKQVWLAMPLHSIFHATNHAGLLHHLLALLPPQIALQLDRNFRQPPVLHRTRQVRLHHYQYCHLQGVQAARRRIFNSYNQHEHPSRQGTMRQAIPSH